MKGGRPSGPGATRRSIEVRPARPTDRAAVWAVQKLAHGRGYWEAPRALGAHLQTAASRALIATREGRPVAYLLARVERRRHITRLGASPNCRRRVGADTLFVHDMALTPAVRGSGLPGRLLGAILGEPGPAGRSPLRHVALISVSGTEAYWRRYGLRRQVLGGVAGADLRSYGPRARYMEGSVRSVRRALGKE